ncbi:MAG: hypothetical protein ACRD6R_09305, partial [Candidatus Polarisedimenticolia bacterium]
MRRRDFVRIVITGSLGALGCRAGTSPPRGGTPRPAVLAETNLACHAVRDGAEFRLPPPSRHHPVVIA